MWGDGGFGHAELIHAVAHGDTGLVASVASELIDVLVVESHAQHAGLGIFDVGFL